MCPRALTRSLSFPLVRRSSEKSRAVFRVKNTVDDGKRVEHPSHAVEVVVGLRDRPDCVSSVAAKPRPDPLVAPEVFLKEGLAILDIATKPLGELGGVIEIEISISMSN